VDEGRTALCPGRADGGGVRVNWVSSLWKAYGANVRAEADAAAVGPAADRQLVVVVLVACACLIFMRFFGSADRLHAHWQPIFSGLGLEEIWGSVRSWLYSHEDAQFHRKLFWAVTRLLGYVLFPMIAVWLWLGSEVSMRRMFGLRSEGFWAHAPVYLAMLAVIQAKYPFYRLAPGEALFPWFFAWEMLYALQFFALEIFFRGFMVHGLAPRLGWASVFVMMIPYMMIHFDKPLLECVGSIAAGFVLGTMSLKTGSIYWGAILHVAIAWAMDALALVHAGRL
jgi:hypothetical protein